jgi:large subunit ribosomal protein L3
VIEGLLGRKLGMIQVFDKQGRLRGATVIQAGPCLITQVKTQEPDGYQAVQIGFGSARRTNKPMRGHLGRQGDLRYLREFRVDDPSKHHVGERIGAEMFQAGDYVDITGVSKGRGFAGVVKRHGFHGGPKTHGQSDRHRAPGSIGSGNTPGRVFKGMRMAGHMGAEQVTVRMLEVLESNAARGTLLVAGSVPGARNGLLRIRYGKATLEEARARKPRAAKDEETPPADEERETAEAKAEQPASEAPEAEETEEAATDGGEEVESPAAEEERS